jgi:hypothetical protein
MEDLLAVPFQTKTIHSDIFQGKTIRFQDHREEDSTVRGKQAF